MREASAKDNNKTVNEIQEIQEKKSDSTLKQVATYICLCTSVCVGQYDSERRKEQLARESENSTPARMKVSRRSFEMLIHLADNLNVLFCRARILFASTLQDMLLLRRTNPN